MIPTPHIQATDRSQIAETILLPGDPLRAKHIAETFLDKPAQFNSVRNMLGYTGYYRDRRVSVMGTGMGMASIGIYSYELIHFYGVKNLIRVGTAGSLQEHVKVRDIVFGMAASTNSNYASQFGMPGTLAPCASWELLSRAVDGARARSLPFHVGGVVSSDTFYNDDLEDWKKWARMGVLAIEMEAAALYMNAARGGVNALTILTISDSLVTHEATTSEERQRTFNGMIEIALELA